MAAGVELSAAEADALELVARLTHCDVSPATLELLARRVDRLCRDYPVRPAPELLTEAGGWLDRTLRLLERRTSLQAHREVLVSAGWLSALVTCLHHDLGHQPGAERWCEATGSLGAESGHAEITGWSHEIAAWMALTAGRPAEALVHAQVGQGIDRMSCVAAQLAAQEARAAAKLGDRVAAEDAMARGRAVLDRLSNPADPDHHFVIDPAKADFYAMGVYRWLGVDDAAQEYAQRARAYSERPDGTIRSPMRRSEALLTLVWSPHAGGSWTPRSTDTGASRSPPPGETRSPPSGHRWHRVDAAHCARCAWLAGDDRRRPDRRAAPLRARGPRVTPRSMRRAK